MTVLQDEPVRYRTKSEWAYLQLLRWIQTGVLRPGERLDQQDLADRLDVTRIPIRQALVRLEADGLVQSRPHQGAVVTGLSLADAEDVYASRMALEAMLAARAAERMSKETAERLAEVLSAQKAAFEGGDFAAFIELDRRFHTETYREAGFPRSLELVSRLRDLSGRYISAFLCSPARARQAMKEHQDILRALRTGKPEDAAEATRRHIEHGLQALRTIIPDEQTTAVLAFAWTRNESMTKGQTK